MIGKNVPKVFVSLAKKLGTLSTTKKNKIVTESDNFIFADFKITCLVFKFS